MVIVCVVLGGTYAAIVDTVQCVIRGHLGGR
jgi:hypothetical protein